MRASVPINLLTVLFLGLMMHVLTPDTAAQEFRLVLLPSKYRTESLEKVDLAKLKPGSTFLLDERDILRYDGDDHRMVLGLFAAERLRKLKVPKTGLPFAVFVGNEAVYAGALFDGYSLERYRGVAVDVRPLREYPPSLLFELDYPPLAPKNPAKDPRGDDRLIAAFEKAGKLYRETWIEATCTGARGTGKRRFSFIFEFDVTNVTRGSFASRKLTFELYADQQGGPLIDAVETNGKVDPKKKFRLIFKQQVKESDPNLWFQRFERID